jgi:hypothetical protein
MSEPTNDKKPGVSAAKDPNTDAEWQEAVDLAELYTQLESAQAYGLITGCPPVDGVRCREILERGRAHGVLPNPESVQRMLYAMVHGE